MTSPVTIHEFHRVIKQDTTFHLNLKEGKYSNTWNQSFLAPAQMDCTHRVSNEYNIPKNDG
jgi:hypothetical protein